MAPVINWKIFNRKIHYWLSLVVALPVAVVIASGLLLQLKKQSDWVQPPTAKGSTTSPSIPFHRILATASSVPQAAIASWDDIDRLDVRPAMGIVKVRARNQWEVQIDTETAEVLLVRYRRSDLIESIHDGSFFHPLAKLWIFLPSGILLLVMWITGLYLFLLPYLVRWRRKK